MTTLPIKSCKNAYRSDFKLSDIVSEILLGELWSGSHLDPLRPPQSKMNPKDLEILNIINMKTRS